MSGRADEASDRPRTPSEHDIYRYPNVVKPVASSLQKGYDIYGEGIILLGVSYWQRIDEIFKVPKGGPLGYHERCQQYQTLAVQRRSGK